MEKLRILLLEDSLLDTELIQAHLSDGGLDCELVRVETRTDFLRALEQDAFDLILSDYSLPAFDGISALAIAQATCPELPFIFVSATLGEELAIETLKSGATDYVLKQRLTRLVPAVQRALREAKEHLDRKRAEAALQTLTAELEKRVEERTAELAKANETLKEQIIERQRAEESLRQSEATLRSYFDLPLIGIAITSLDKSWIEVNDKLCNIFGYERHELKQVTWLDLTHPEDRAADLEQFNQLAAGAIEGYSLDKRFICKQGRVIYANLLVRCVRRIDGSVNYFVALIQDITERKRAEEERAELIREQGARREAEEQSRKLAFLAQASTVLSSSLDYETTLASVANLAVPDLADWCAVDILDEKQGIRRVALAHLDPSKVELAWELNRRYPDDPNASQGLPKILRTGQSAIATEITDADLIAAAQDAEHLRMLREIGFKSCMIVPLLARGRTLGAITVVTAESERRYNRADLPLLEDLAHRAALAVENARLYRETQRSQQVAEAANRTKDEFLATLSHELRTPLNAMLGWTQLLQTRKLNEDKMARALETIDRNTKSLAALIEDILDVSRIITGKLHLSTRACELGPVIEAAIEAVRPAAEAKTIHIELFLDASAGLVWADANRLQQVVWNLLSNAIKFTPKGGRVEVRLEHSGDDSSDRSYTQIRVIDTGKGIAPDFLPYVFERFRQENNTSTRAYGGLGLGLAIVRYLVELHGGTVHAFSQGEGLGATFTVQLPLFMGNRDTAKHSPLSTRGTTPISRSLLNGLQVLIVDDDADARELLTTILEQCGAKVTAATCAAEAFDSLSKSKPDVLVSDIAMPNVDGYALIRQLRALEAEPGEYIPAVALTAYARESDRTLALKAGFQVHLTKPYQPDELVNVIARLTGCTQKRSLH